MFGAASNRSRPRAARWYAAARAFSRYARLRCAALFRRRRRCLTPERIALILRYSDPYFYVWAPGSEWA